MEKASWEQTTVPLEKQIIHIGHIHRNNYINKRLWYAKEFEYKNLVT